MGGRAPARRRPRLLSLVHTQQSRARAGHGRGVAVRRRPPLPGGNAPPAHPPPPPTRPDPGAPTPAATPQAGLRRRRGLPGGERRHRPPGRSHHRPARHLCAGGDVRTSGDCCCGGSLRGRGHACGVGWRSRGAAGHSPPGRSSLAPASFGPASRRPPRAVFSDTRRRRAPRPAPHPRPCACREFAAIADEAPSTPTEVEAGWVKRVGVGPRGERVYKSVMQYPGEKNRKNMNAEVGGC